jgi:hypothetical protein
MTLTSNL